MELLQIKFCIFEYSKEAILQVKTFQRQILSLQKTVPKWPYPQNEQWESEMP